MKKFVIILMVFFGVALSGCGMSALTISPVANTYTYGDPAAEFLEISGAPAGSVVHYTMTEDGTKPTLPTCDSTIYSDRIPLRVGTTRVMAIACGIGGHEIATTGDTSDNIIIVE